MTDEIRAVHAFDVSARLACGGCGYILRHLMDGDERGTYLFMCDCIKCDRHGYVMKCRAPIVELEVVADHG